MLQPLLNTIKIVIFQQGEERDSSGNQITWTKMEEQVKTRSTNVLYGIQKHWEIFRTLIIIIIILHIKLRNFNFILKAIEGQEKIVRQKSGISKPTKISLTAISRLEEGKNKFRKNCFECVTS